MSVRHMSCRHCGQDIEGISPFRRGEWRDRGNNTHCPTPEGDAGQVHEPFIERYHRTAAQQRPPKPRGIA